MNVKNQMPKTVRKLLKKGVLNTSKEEEKRVKQPEKSMKKKTTSLPVFHLQRPVVEEKEEEKTEEEMIVVFWLMTSESFIETSRERCFVRRHSTSSNTGNAGLSPPRRPT